MRISLGKDLNTGYSLDYEIKMGGHTMVAGLTGFGKSNEVNYILYQMAKYSQIQMIICNAIGKPDYIQWLPRASAVAIGLGATNDAVDGLIDLMMTRYKDLLPAGIKQGMTPRMAREIALQGARSVQISDDLPLIVLVIDEFVQYLLVKKFKSTEKLMTLVTLLRAAGGIVILATQRPSHEVVSTQIRENMPYKIAFALDRFGCAMMFGSQADEIPLEELDTPGEGYAIVDGQRIAIPFIAPECNEKVVGAKAIQTEHLRQEIKGIEWYSDGMI
jgi:S-DNA-T family DNA segregation ATPase FtsK/SpoIIIE